MFKKIYRLCIGLKSEFFIFYPSSQTILIHTDLDKCVFEMLRFYGTNHIKLNEYNEDIRNWNYVPDYQYRHRIFIEELSIGNLMPINEKIIYCLKKGKLCKKICNFKVTWSYFKLDESFIFEYLPLTNFDFYNINKLKKMRHFHY